MDVFIPNRQTHPAAEQNRLASQRNPGSLARSWQNARPLHGLSLAGRTNAGQLAARMARSPQIQTLNSRDMFPFRIFLQPSQTMAEPGWEDNYGPAAWRTFQVWTGTALAYLFQKAKNGPTGMNLYIPQVVYVGRTSGYNNYLAENQFVGENYNEYFANMDLGNYLANPNNPNGTGPAAYVNSYDEVIFTARPSSFAVFWISWDTNSPAMQAPHYTSKLSGGTFARFPTLHFGGIDSNGDYYGDLTMTNGPGILGFGGGFGSIDGPAQQFPYFAASALNNGNVSIPEGCIIVGSIQIGVDGSNSGFVENDGIVQIYQQTFNNILTQPPRNRYRGGYQNSEVYYPGEIVGGFQTNLIDSTSAELGCLYFNATDFAINGLAPASQPGPDPVGIGPGYDEGVSNPESWTNIWMPLSVGVQQAQIISEEDDYLICNLVTQVDFEDISTDTTPGDESYVVACDQGSIILVAKPFDLMKSVYDGNTLPFPNPYDLDYQALHTDSDATQLATFITKNQRLLGDYQQAIWPPYVTGQLINVGAVPGGTGLFVDNVQVTFQDANTAARTWATEWPCYQDETLAVYNDSGELTNPEDLLAGFRLVVSSQFYITSIAG